MPPLTIKQWLMGAIVIVMIAMVLAVYQFATERDGPAFTAAEAWVNTNPIVEKYVGAPVMTSFGFSRNETKYSGKRIAKLFTVAVRGSVREGSVYIRVRTEGNGEWMVTEAILVKPEGWDRLDLP